MKIKESEKINKYLDRDRELKKGNMMMIPFLVCSLRTVLKGLEKDNSSWKSEQESIVLLKLVRILGKIQETREDL